jgi:O-antigen/teichoic acid export membrane protein
MGITRGLKETKYSVYIYDIGHSGSAVLLIAVLGTFAPRPRSAAIAYLTALLVGVVLTGWYLVRLGVFDHLRRATVHTREFLSYSPSVFLIIAVQYLLSWTDVVVLSVYSTQARIGYYQVAFQTSILVLLVLKALNSIFPSVAAELYDSGRIEALETLYVASTKWASFVTLQLAAFVVLASESILTLFGAGFSSANLALLFLVVGQSVTALSGPAGNLLSMTSNERIETVNTVSVALLNLALNLLLVREYGITGAAAATGVSLALLNVIRVVEVRYFLGFTPFQPRFAQIPILLGVTWALGSEAKTLVTGALPTVVTTGVVAGGVTLVGVYLLYDEDSDQSLITTVS